MKPERWQTVQRIFHTVMQSEASQRSSVIDRACKDDESLRYEIESLVKYSQRTGQILRNRAFDVVAQALAQEQLRGNEGEPSDKDKMIGARIAQYQIVARLGTGGMGEVYRAVRADDTYQKEVALKLVRQGLDSDTVYRRFRNERQILAPLEHENIARLLDGGTTQEGIPYFVMELVEGQPLDEYCDARKLGIVDRIRMFQAVCSAVQYAHQHLVVHRDIKPKNVLVTAEGVPKLLDFGIATILSPEAASPAADPTVTVARMMTPEFASPEQLRSESITTATDVYSLGLLLYKLLTGRMPYRPTGDSGYDLAHAICQEEPVKASVVVRPVERGPDNRGAATTAKEWISASRGMTPDKLHRTLSGDLDQILLRALRKEPQQRYPSVQSFSDDLRLYLAGMPVLARRGTFTYRTNKFIRRNRISLAVASAVALMTVVGIAAIVRERARTQQEFDSLRKLTNSMLFEFHDSIKTLPGSTSARELVVRRALEYLNQMDAEAHGDPAVQRDLAAAYERIARIQAEEYYAHLGGPGASEQARQLLEKALAIRESLASANPADIGMQFDLIDVIKHVATFYYLNGDLDHALEMQQRGLQIEERLGTRQQSEELQYRTAGSLIGIGVLKHWFGDYEAALDYERRSLAINEMILRANPASAVGQRQLKRSHEWIAATLKFERKYTEAANERREAIIENERLLAGDPNNTDFQRDQDTDNGELCKILAYAGKFSDAPGYCSKAISFSEKMVEADKNNVQAAADLAGDNATAEISYYLMHLPRQALLFGQRADRMFDEVRARDPDSIGNAFDHGVTLLFLGRIEAQLKQPASARNHMELARDMIRQAAKQNPKNQYFQDSIAEVDAAIKALPRDTAPVGIH